MRSAAKGVRVGRDHEHEALAIVMEQSSHVAAGICERSIPLGESAETLATPLGMGTLLGDRDGIRAVNTYSDPLLLIEA